MDRRLFQHHERPRSLVTSGAKRAARAAGLAALGWSVLLPPPAHAASELSRKQSTVTVERNAITVDRDIAYGGYRAGDRLDVAVEYSGACKIVFQSLALFKPSPFAPIRAVTGDFGNVRGTPPPNHAATTGMVTFDLRFKTLSRRRRAGKPDWPGSTSSSASTRIATSPPATSTAWIAR